MRKLSLLFAVGVLLVCNSLFAGPVLEIGEQSISADGLSPGGAAVFFHVARERRSWTTHVDRGTRIEVDEDGDGRSGFRLGREVPFHSVWCVVDLLTGEYDIAVPGGFPRKERTAPSDGLTEDPDGLIRRLRDARGYLEVLLVRPTVGAWRLTVGDGAESYSDGVRDGVSQVLFADMLPVNRSPSPPDYLVRGDTLIVIDPRNLGFFSTRIAGGGE